MTFATSRPHEGTLTRAALATTFVRARPLIVPGLVRRAAIVIGDLLALAGIGLCVPVVILAIGTPLVLCVRLLLWIAGVTA
jgi:hypothetical protein